MAVINERPFLDSNGKQMNARIIENHYIDGVSATIELKYAIDSNSRMSIKKIVRSGIDENDTVLSYEKSESISKESHFTIIDREIKFHSSQRGKYVQVIYYASGTVKVSSKEIATDYKGNQIILDEIMVGMQGVQDSVDDVSKSLEITDSKLEVVKSDVIVLDEKIVDVNNNKLSKSDIGYVNVCDHGLNNEGKLNDDLKVNELDEMNKILLFPKGTYALNIPPTSKCKGEGAVLIIGEYEITLSDIPFNVNSVWQDYIRMNNTFIGLESGKNTDNVNGYSNVGIGHQALRDNVKTVRNTAIGNNSQMSLTDGYGNTSVGTDSLHLGKYSDRNTMLGATCGKNIGNINPNESNGLFNGVINTAINYDAFWSEWRAYTGGVGGCLHVPTTADETTSNVGVGRNALGFSQKPTRNVAIGYNALEGGIAPDNMIAIGESCLQFGVKSENSVFVGGRCGYHNMDNSQDIAIGKSAMENTVHSTKNVAIGYQSLLGTQSPKESVITSNVAIGRLAMANYQGSIIYNVGIGEQSLLLVKNTTGTEGNGNVGVGYGTLAKVTTGSYNTAIGHNAGNRSGTETHTNTTSLGYNAFCNGSNQIQLGNSDTTTYVYGTVQNRSDRRDKADVRETSLGLDFINKLNPVEFKWDLREDYEVYNEEGEIIETKSKDGSKKRDRYHQGLIAQEVKVVMDELGVDFGGYQDHSINGGGDVLSIGYDELIAPLIKSIQELTARVKELENKN